MGTNRDGIIDRAEFNAGSDDETATVDSMTITIIAVAAAVAISVGAIWFFRPSHRSGPTLSHQLQRSHKATVHHDTTGIVMHTRFSAGEQGSRVFADPSDTIRVAVPSISSRNLVTGAPNLANGKTVH